MEGIVKAVSIKPIKLEADGELNASVCAVQFYLDAVALAALYQSEGIDPADIKTITVTIEDGETVTQQINLAEAARTNLEICRISSLNVAFASN